VYNKYNRAFGPQTIRQRQEVTMKTCSRVIAAFLILAGGTLGFARQAKTDPYAAQLKKLEHAYSQDLRRFYKPVNDAKTDEERAKAEKGLDFKNAPFKVYLPQFEELAHKAGDRPSACNAYNMMFQCARQLHDGKGQTAAMDAWIKKFKDSPMFADFVYYLDPDQWPDNEAGLRHLAGWRAMLAKSKSPEVLAAIAFHAAETTYADGQGDTIKAKTLYQKVVSDYPNTIYATQAKSQVYEFEHLSIGMPAPDFTASDQDGVTFKLSDYRGKVVLLDFWGFW
jgi:hypothetical protein